MTRVLLILALVGTAFWVYSVVDCAVQPATRHRGVNKAAWIVIVLVLPVLGGIMWFVLGRTRKSSKPAFRAPDDDPEFLGRLGTISDQDERIRRLEEELAQLDAEADDPRTTRPPASSGTGATAATPGTTAGTSGGAGAAGADTTGTDPVNPSEGDGDEPRGRRGIVS